MREAVIVSGVRTAIGNFGGSLQSVPAVDLGAAVLKAALRRAGLRPEVSTQVEAMAPDKLKGAGLIELEKKQRDWEASATPVSVDEVIMGQVLQAGLGQNPARQAMIRAGISKETPAMTVNKVCGSGLKAVAIGASAIMTGQAEVVLAGGQENMSQVPLSLPKARWGHRMEISGVGEVVDLMVFDGLYEIFYGYHMGITAENIAAMYGISRREQDELGVLSHRRARAAIAEGLFEEEILPVAVKTRKGESVFAVDERPLDTDVEKMAKLRPAFKPDGTVTAGNASGINDAAAAVLMMSAERARTLNLESIVRIKAFAAGGVDPAYMGLGPVPAIRKALDAAELQLSDIDLIELNEAFAAQAIGCMRELGIETDRPNELGSGISLGHPIGCTGTRQVVTAMHQMRRKGYASGLISMCIGGGMGMAMVIER
ncbi:MAG: acetyl-CoA acetyltransferase [Deltaproteobacteria bacterium SG8_13]|nr:MAG: acetyl-CoA acetyltransferase [Deltaproteobacteria bacterium SG8_13]